MREKYMCVKYAGAIPSDERQVPCIRHLRDTRGTGESLRGHSPGTHANRKTDRFIPIPSNLGARSIYDFFFFKSYFLKLPVLIVFEK